MEHCCELLRHSVGCDVVAAVEYALIDLWVRGRLSPNAAPPCSDDRAVNCTQCASVLDSSNYKATRTLTLWTYESELQGPICTNLWRGEIHVLGCNNPAGQITGADAANFLKVLYKCYGIIVKDLRKKGFHISLESPVNQQLCNADFDMSATINVGVIPAVFGLD